MSAQGVDERMINVHYYYRLYDLLGYLLVCAYTCDVCTVYVGALNTCFCVDMFMLHT